MFGLKILRDLFERENMNSNHVGDCRFLTITRVFKKKIGSIKKTMTKGH